MNKKQNLLAQANQLLQKVKELEVMERQKIGQLVYEMYEKKEIKDEVLINRVAKIIGDIVVNKVVAKPSIDVVSTGEVGNKND